MVIGPHILSLDCSSGMRGAPEQKMDADFFVDAGGDGDGRRCRHRDQTNDSKGPPICKIRASLERPAFQLQISRVSVRSRRGLDRVFWCFDFRTPSRRPRLSPIPILIGLSRMYLGAHYLRTLFARQSWGLYARSVVAHVLLLTTSPIGTQNLDGGGGEIRTHEAFRPSGFQDRRNEPLCHPSRACDQ